MYNLKHFRHIRFANAILQPLGTGAYHAAVEVHSTEFSYGFAEEGTGVFERLPAGDERHSYRQAIVMGRTQLSAAEVQAVVERLKEEWLGNDYHMLRNNCQHFAAVLCRELGVGEVPCWVTNLVPVIARLNNVRKAAKETGRRARSIAGVYGGSGSSTECARLSRDCCPRSYGLSWPGASPRP